MRREKRVGLMFAARVLIANIQTLKRLHGQDGPGQEAKLHCSF